MAVLVLQWIVHLSAMLDELDMTGATCDSQALYSVYEAQFHTQRRTGEDTNMDPRHTALVLIEYQNDFTSDGGSLHGAVQPVMEATQMLANTVVTVMKARELGATIVHAPITFTPDYHELTSEPYGILKGVVDSKSFRKGTWGAEIVDDLRPEEQDIVIEGKRGLDGFASTNLDFILRSRGITNIALGGFLTNCCVESTMRTGYEKGYNVVTLKDCTATVSAEEQRLAVEKNYPMFSRPMNHDEFLAELSRGPAVAAPSLRPSQPTQAVRARPAAPGRASSEGVDTSRV